MRKNFENMNKTTIVALVVAAIASSAVVFIITSRKKMPPPRTEDTEVVVGWKEDFSVREGSGKGFLPGNWKVRGKPGTAVSSFKVTDGGGDGTGKLTLISDSSSGSIITAVKNVDLSKTPYLRWRWKAHVLPEGADGRDPSRDDQAIGIYVGDGSMLNSKSISYRWDTETPVLAEGYVSYGMGTVKVKWITLRNSGDMESGEWFTESRNVLSDFSDAWGMVPKKVYVSVTTNSQYTGSRAEAELDWIEFVAL
jgi:hypothetical protein